MSGKNDLWGAQWYSRNALDGESRYIIWDQGKPLLFLTRREARMWIRNNYGYMAGRRDLREEPHGWRMPRAVRVMVQVTLVT